MAKKKYVHKNITHKQIKKTIKRDELRNLVDKSYSFMRGNTENMLIAGIILVVIIILVPLYFKTRADNERRANEMMNRAMTYAQQPIDPSMVNPSNQVFRNAEEKYRKTQQTYAEVVANYRNNWVADQAKVGEANALFYLKEYEKALAIYQAELVQQKEPFMQATVQERVGTCQESLQRWADAQQTYQSLLQKFPNYFNRRAVRLALARCLWRMDKQAEGLKIMQEEENIEPGTYWTEMARLQRVYLENEQTQKAPEVKK